ncbi:MAG TPA: prolipoprotein diacylglyceryl transferase [Caldisericia bacterium]|jgi:phosphatidylglycerol:prolipoprotein diacylglycerol transferase|nr:prolipoprotein diacylglyceryl transferase [Caldisericia bacterium]HOC79511.1 prolipoprotein diacylglyceryl transferase [Caldisericia bacterium]HOG70661.1 prolipoprotein diacylglyceryl transferase [Caldisericia bacterium]HPA66203.1 prolipoprotein diacylglyceryl transferase [Caldisericia bacterium]HPM44305.1 prolipoprotein diacylglyceryl transferase [Caldisericia bacterium]
MHPIAFFIGNFEIRWYGILITVGIIAGVAYAWTRCKYHGLKKNDLYDLAFMGVLVGIIGARLMYVFTNNFSYWLANPLEIFTLQMSGLSFIGIIVFNIPAVAIFAKVRKLSFWRIMDLAAPSIAIGYFFGRLGCFMNGCCYGPECSWGIVMPGTGKLVPVFPTQLVNAAVAVIMFFVLYWVSTKRKFFQGWLFTLFLYMYTIFHLGTEFLRSDPGHGALFGTPFNSAQMGNILGLLLAIGLHIYLRRSKIQSTVSNEEVALIEQADKEVAGKKKEEPKEEEPEKLENEEEGKDQ